MFARVMSAEIGADDKEKFVGMIRDQVIPKAQRLPGFVGGYWLLDQDNGKVLGITLYESKQALDASEEAANRIREEASRSAGLPIPSFRRYEVVESVLQAEKKAA